MITMEEIFEDIEASGGVTPSRRLRDIASRFPERIAFRDKKFGIWNEISYKEFWLQVNYVGCALKLFWNVENLIKLLSILKIDQNG